MPKRTTILLLASVVAIALSMAIPTRVSPVAVARPISAAPLGPVIAIGDSITYGFGDGVTRTIWGPAPRYSYPWDLQQILGTPVVNAGISADTARWVLHPEEEPGHHRPVSLQIPALLALHPRMVVAEFGTMEALFTVPAARAAADLDALLSAFQNIPTVIVGTHVWCPTGICDVPQPVPYAQPPGEYVQTWDALLEGLAARHHSGLVLDVEHGLADLGLMSDDFHPNVAGYLLVARRVAAAVTSRLAD